MWSFASMQTPKEYTAFYSSLCRWPESFEMGVTSNGPRLSAPKEALVETVLAAVLAIMTILAPTDVMAQAAPWDGSYGNQCCTCCEGGTVVGRERQCVTTTIERCRSRGWVCYGYVLCPK